MQTNELLDKYKEYYKYEEDKPVGVMTLVEILNQYGFATLAAEWRWLIYFIYIYIHYQRDKKKTFRNEWCVNWSHR